jgi:hypothetical protein
MLNYGHTLAHALEVGGRFDLRHGEAVAIGVDSAGVVVTVVLVVLLSLEVAGEGFTTVVLFSVFSAGEAAGATVSVFCSQAARSAALARIQMYFFIGYG